MNNAPSTRGVATAAQRMRELAPRGSDYKLDHHALRRDLVAGLTVAVVALPLALGFGVASGLGAGAGLITAIVAGIVAGVFGGSNVQVSGPTGAMTVVLIPVVASVGADGVLIVASMAGVLLIVAGWLRLGRYAGLLPWPVVEGFTIGIGLLIFLQQVPQALGVATPDGENTLVVALAAIGDWAGSGWSAPALVVAVVAAIELATRAHRALPAALIAVIAATAAAEAGIVGVDRIGEIPAALPALVIPSAPLSELPALVAAALAVAALAGIESLLSAKVADGLSDSGPHDPDRELVGQGLANVAVSVTGGVPATGAIARTAVAVRAGAQTRLATITHGAVLVVAVVAITPLLERIPLAALAGVLMATAIRMIDVAGARRIIGASRADAWLLLLTVGATVAFDLVTAVAVGVVLAGIHALRELARASSLQRDDVHERGGLAIDGALEHALLQERILVFRFDGALFFGAARRMLDELSEVGPVEVVILRLGSLKMLDSTGAQALAGLIEDLEARGMTVLLESARPHHVRLLKSTGVLDALRHDRHLLPDLAAALDHARRHHGDPAERAAERAAALV